MLVMASAGSERCGRCLRKSGRDVVMPRRAELGVVWTLNSGCASVHMSCLAVPLSAYRRSVISADEPG